MNCRQSRALLSDHLEGLLDTRRGGQMTVHLRDCAACRRMRDEMLRFEQAVREVTSPVAPDQPLRERAAVVWLAEAQAAKRSDRSSQRGARPASRIQALLWASAAGATIVLAAVLAPPRARHGGQAASSQPVVQTWEGERGKAGERSDPTSRTGGRSGLSERRPAAPLKERQELVSSPRAEARSARAVSMPRSESRAETAARPGPGRTDTRGEGDLQYLNASLTRELGRWTPLQTGEWERIEARVRQAVHVRDDFVLVPFPRVAAAADRQIVAATEAYNREAAIVDARLAREVTLGLKAMALSDICERMRNETGIDLRAGPSVADEKVTLFCRRRSLREVMRQLSRPFGYAWLRSRQASGDGSWELGKEGARRSPTPNSHPPSPTYRYELVQDLRSQLLEEELRNRARNEALLALDREMQRYRPHLALSPDEALERSKSASAPEKKLLENLAGKGWGAIQMYFRISPRDLDRLRAGEGLDFLQEPLKENQQPLPLDVARGVLQSMRDVRIRGDRGGEGGATIGGADELADGVPPTSFPEARARVALRLGHSELGQFTFDGRGGVYVGQRITIGGGEYATGTSSAVHDPKNAEVHAPLARDRSLSIRVTVRPEASCRPDPSLLFASRPRKGGAPVAPAEPPGPKATSADVLEALHRATGLPIAADSYTRLFPLPNVSLQNVTLFDALNQLADTMRLRWDRDKEGGWLQFRSVSYFDDRLKEVPNRLLFRWAAARREHGFLPLDHLIEIAGLTDIQLDSPTMAEGAGACFGLAEWSLARNSNTRPHLRYLATLTPAQREVAQSAEGLPFARLSLAQQQQLLAHLGSRLEWAHIHSLEQLSGAAVRVEYTQPGSFCWHIPETVRREGERGPPSRLDLLRGGFFGLTPVRESTREAALQAARRFDSGADASQITPTELALGVVYMLTDPTTGGLHVMGARGDGISTRIGW